VAAWTHERALMTGPLRAGEQFMYMLAAMSSNRE
jgi:hypothetical protein